MEVLVTSTGSPNIAELKYFCASAVDSLMQPLETFVEPCTSTVSGLAWMNSPLSLIRTAHFSCTLE